MQQPRQSAEYFRDYRARKAAEGKAALAELESVIQRAEHVGPECAAFVREAAEIARKAAIAASNARRKIAA